jgi:hypothetical protein
MCGPEPPYRAPVIRPIARVESPVIQEKINSAQAVIVARALKMGGIFLPPVK